MPLKTILPKEGKSSQAIEMSFLEWKQTFHHDTIKYSSALACFDWVMGTYIEAGGLPSLTCFLMPIFGRFRDLFCCQRASSTFDR